jgi:hypothetical protein
VAHLGLAAAYAVLQVCGYIKISRYLKVYVRISKASEKGGNIKEKEGRSVGSNV